MTKYRCKYCNEILDDPLGTRHICPAMKTKWNTKKLGKSKKEPERFMITYRAIS